MSQETIDFGKQRKRIGVSPVVISQMLELQCRTGSQVQATLLGQVYSTSIEIVQQVAVGLCDGNQVKIIDFTQHHQALQNITCVYPTLQVVGVALTSLQPTINLAVLHTMYSNKESGFKVQGILQYPILLAVTPLSITAYSFNPTFKYCKEFMEVTCFEKLDARVSLDDTDFGTIAPLFEPINEQQSMVGGSAKQMIKELIVRLRQLKGACDKGGDPSLKIHLREIVEKLNSKHISATDQLSYLLELGALQNTIAMKLTQLQ